MNQVNSTKLVQFHPQEKILLEFLNEQYGLHNRDEINNKNLPRHKHKTSILKLWNYKMSLDVFV